MVVASGASDAHSFTKRVFSRVASAGSAAGWRAAAPASALVKTSAATRMRRAISMFLLRSAPLFAAECAHGTLCYLARVSDLPRAPWRARRNKSAVFSDPYDPEWVVMAEN